jgi:hypothetical protein
MPQIANPIHNGRLDMAKTTENSNAKIMKLTAALAQVANRIAAKRPLVVDTLRLILAVMDMAPVPRIKTGPA